MFSGDSEEKLQKKQRRIIRASVWCIGIGLGLLAARIIAPLFAGESDDAGNALVAFGFSLTGYGAAQLIAIAFLRRHAPLACSIITYIILPAVLLKLFADMH
ncbi:MAG: hypothetical protein HY370_00695 [Proteobacteria bacterium]|nr:hypothetical protein [Pseudomonadota bacterium]